MSVPGNFSAISGVSESFKECSMVFQGISWVFQEPQERSSGFQGFSTVVTLKIIGISKDASATP